MFNEEGAFQTNALALVQTATAHDHAVDAEKWEKDETNHWHVCTICDEAVDVAAHTYGDWTEVTPASVDAEGLRSHTCTVCGYEENDVIPKIEAASSEESGEEQSSEVPSGEVSSEVGTADGDDLDPDALGCKSVVGASFGLLFVVAGAAIMIGKKKEH